VSRTSRITDEMFMAAARTLASMVDESDLAQGSLYPALTRVREVSAHIATAVAAIAFEAACRRARAARHPGVCARPCTSRSTRATFPTEPTRRRATEEAVECTRTILQYCATTRSCGFEPRRRASGK
jgi:hypothetical protein